MKDHLLGTTLPVLSISLEPGESVIAEAGEFSWMTDSIQMSTGGGGGTGPGSTGRPGPEGLLSTYTAQGAPGIVAFASKTPGSIVPVDVAPGRNYLVHRRGFLAGVPGIQITAGFRQSFSAGVFAGEGFVLQRLGGTGRAWVELAGEAVRHDLAPGQSLRAHPGHVGMFEASVTFQVMRVPGISNRYFGGDTHHFAVMSGPGAVWLQSLPLSLLAASLAPYLGEGDSGRAGGAANDDHRFSS